MADLAAPLPRATTVIVPRGGGVASRAREVWRARRLVLYFGKRFVEKRYARTWLGWAWIPLRPLLSVGSRILVFGAVLSVPSTGIPYPVFFLAGLAAWELFSEVSYFATRSMELNRRVLKRMFVPRLILLLAAAGPGILDALLYGLLALIAAFIYLGVDGQWFFDASASTLLVPVALAYMLLAAYGIGLWLSVFAAQARDVRFMLRYVLGFWFFLTPVIYPVTAIPESFRSLASLNPLTAPVEALKLGLFNTGTVPTTAIAISAGFIVVLLASGLWFFFRAEEAALDHL